MIKSDALVQEICSKLQFLIVDSVEKHKSDSIALSGGLDSAILAFCIRDKKIPAFVVVTKDFPSTDLVHAQLVAKTNHMKLEVVTATIEDLLDAIEQTIKILKVFNPIEIRNNIVVYLAMKNAKENGCKSIMTGDGADELFAGYKFFQKLSTSELAKDLERIWKIMHFPSKSISRSLRISVHSPFLDKTVVEYAKTIPADLKVREERGRKHGKWILRKTFENLLPCSIVWREKAAMQNGAGTGSLPSFFNGVMPESVFSEKIKKYVENEKVHLMSKESLYYYEIYRKYYDVPIRLGESKIRCPQCNYSRDKDSRFCRMCGSFPI